MLTTATGKIARALTASERWQWRLHHGGDAIGGRYTRDVFLFPSGGLSMSKVKVITR